MKSSSARIWGAAIALSVAGVAGCQPPGEPEPTVGVTEVRLSGQERFIVKFRDAARGRAALRAAGADVVLELGPQDAAAAIIPQQALLGLQRNPAIALIEPDPIREASPFDTTTPEAAPYGIAMVRANQVSYGASKRTVCVIDSGYDAAHPDLPHGARVSGESSSRSGTWNVDRCGHGTHVAGTIAALDNAFGVIGVVPGEAANLDLYVVKVFGSDKNESCNWTYASSLIAAANSCKANGANVISMSLGGGSSSSVESVAFANLLSDGILSVAAAGNDGNTSFSYPASYESVVSVAAIDQNGQKASFSQANSQVEVAAPGVGVRSTIPLACRNCPSGSTGYDSWNGTSMATPHVSAVAALIWSHDVTKTASEVRDALRNGASELGVPGRDDATGFGLLDAAASLLCLSNPGDPSCVPNPCGDGTCDGSETCSSCATDCGACPVECGDGSCAASEDSCGCAADCGAPAAAEAQCGDGIDDDCDGAVDCADADCADAAECQPATAGQCDACTTDADCVEGARCFQLTSESGRTCHLSCSSSADCPSGLQCNRVSRGYGQRCTSCP